MRRFRLFGGFSTSAGRQPTMSSPRAWSRFDGFWHLLVCRARRDTGRTTGLRSLTPSSGALGRPRLICFQIGRRSRCNGQPLGLVLPGGAGTCLEIETASAAVWRTSRVCDHPVLVGPVVLHDRISAWRGRQGLWPRPRSGARIVHKRFGPDGARNIVQRWSLSAASTMVDCRLTQTTTCRGARSRGHAVLHCEWRTGLTHWQDADWERSMCQTIRLNEVWIDTENQSAS